MPERLGPETPNDASPDATPDDLHKPILRREEITQEREAAEKEAGDIAQIANLLGEQGGKGKGVTWFEVLQQEATERNETQDRDKIIARIQEYIANPISTRSFEERVENESKLFQGIPKKYFADRVVLAKLMEVNPTESAKMAPGIFFEDPKFVAEAFNRGAWPRDLLEKIPGKVWDDREVMVAFARIGRLQPFYAYSEEGKKLLEIEERFKELAKDRSFLLDAIKGAPDYGGLILRYAPADILSDPEFMLEAIRVNPNALGYASDEIIKKVTGDPALMLEAIRVNPRMFQYASDEIKRRVTGVLRKPESR